MPVANQLRESMKRSSWIREMFEEGARLKAIHGEDQVHDFSLEIRSSNLPTGSPSITGNSW